MVIVVVMVVVMVVVVMEVIVVVVVVVAFVVVVVVAAVAAATGFVEAAPEQIRAECGKEAVMAQMGACKRRVQVKIVVALETDVKQGPNEILILKPNKTQADHKKG